MPIDPRLDHSSYEACAGEGGSHSKYVTLEILHFICSLQKQVSVIGWEVQVGLASFPCEVLYPHVAALPAPIRRKRMFIWR